MSKRFAIAILPKEKQQGGVKYGLKIEKPSALGNVYGLTEEELKELRESEMWQAGAVVRKLRPENN